MFICVWVCNHVDDSRLVRLACPLQLDNQKEQLYIDVLQTIANTVGAPVSQVISLTKLSSSDKRN